MHYLLKWIKFSVKKNKTLKKVLKNGKNTGKSQRILSVRKSGNPAILHPLQSVQESESLASQYEHTIIGATRRLLIRPNVATDLVT